MCSSSMLVMTAIDGHSTRNERSLSSASATMYWPRPSRALLPKALRRPPMTAVGSRPALSSTSAIIEVVVVLPCDPATAIANFRRISSASISARGITGMPRRCASASSGIGGTDRRGVDHHVGVAHVRGGMALVDAHAAGGLEPRRHVGTPGIRSADDVAEVGQQLGDAAHADAAHADEVHAPGSAEHQAPAPARSMMRAAISAAALGRASAAAARPMRSRAAGSAPSAAISFARRAPPASR